MAPDDDVEKLVEELLGNVVLRAVCHSILMNNEDVEPIIGLVRRTKEIDLVLEKDTMETLVTYRAETVDGQVGRSFSEEQGMDVDVLER